MAAPHVAGVQPVRGSLVGVVRADVLLTGQAGGAPGPLARVLLAATQPEPCGVLVDAVGELLWVGDAGFPATFGTPGVRGRTADGLFWMARQIERGEAMARLVDAGLHMALTRGTAEADWLRRTVERLDDETLDWKATCHDE